MANDFRAAFKMGEARRLMLRLMVCVGGGMELFGLVLVLPIAITKNKVLGAIGITLVVAGGALLITGIVLTAYLRRCPGCKQLLYRMLGKFCPYCGGQLLD